MLHRVSGLPLRIIFLCSWHRVHFALIGIGITCFGAGWLLHNTWLRLLGQWIAAPSMVCLLLLPILAMLFIALEKILSGPPGT